MLAPSNANLVSRDASIPGLRILLDDESLAATLDAHLPEWQLRQPRIDYLRYKPRTYCLARVVSGSSRLGVPAAYIVAYTDALRSKFDEHDRASIGDQSGAMHRLPQNLIIYRFPFDRRVSSLGATASSVRLVDLLRQATPGLSCGCDVTASVLRYKPERRCVLRLASDEQTIGVLKLYDSAGYHRARRAAKTISGMDGFGHPRCIGQSKRRALLLYEWCAGQEMSRGLDDAKPIGMALAAAASSLSNLHRQRTSKLPVESAAAFHQRMHLHLADLTWIAPEIGAAAACLWTKIRRWLSQFPAGRQVPIHGDLHVDQFIVDGDAVRLVDFDRSRLADPAEDLAAIYASLIRHRLCVGGCSVAEKQWNEFAAAYKRAGGAVDHMRVRVLTATCLLQSLVEPFRLRHPDWNVEAWHALEVAERMMPASFAARRPHPTVSAKPRVVTELVRVVDPYSLTSDVTLVGDGAPLCVRRAKDRLSCVPSFDGRHAGIELRAIRVLRHKPGRRCMIEYQGTSLTTHQPVAILGKIDAKRRQEKRFRQQLELWRSCSRDTRLDAVRLARPWAVVHEWDMWLQERVEGHEPWPHLSGSAGPQIGSRIGRALAQLHRVEVSTDRSHGLEDELTLLNERLVQAASQLPCLSSRIARLQSSYERLALRHPISRPRAVHRDFYPDQVLVTGPQITILDFDLLADGDPAIDVGNFLAHLLERSLRDAHRPDAFLPAAAAFQTEYLRCCPDVSSETIELYTLLSLARHIWLCANLPGRQHNVIRVLEHCEELVQSCASQRSCSFSLPR